MKIFALFNWIYFTVIIFISLGLMIIFFYKLPKPYSRKLSAKIIKFATFISTEVKGEEDLDTQLFLLNHQSDLDIFIMEYISSKDLAWVAKKELFDIPFFGLALKLPKDIAVERESKMALLSLIKDASRVLEKKRTITMFPEGTRSTKGKMLPFKSGAKIIADKYKLKVCERAEKSFWDTLQNTYSSADHSFIESLDATTQRSYLKMAKSKIEKNCKIAKNRPFQLYLPGHENF